MTEPSSPSGTLRRGSRLSSARGAVASQPLYAKIENTTARNSDPPAGTLAGSNGDRVKPPGPGLKSPCTASATLIASSGSPAITSTPSERRIPPDAVQATTPTPPNGPNQTGN